MNFFKKNKNEGSYEHLMLTPIQVTRLSVGLLLTVFFIFMAGYYWGKKQAVEQLAVQFSQDSFADKVYASLCSLYDISEEGDKDKEEGDAEFEIETEASEASDNNEVVAEKQLLYNAQLTGYANFTQADAYCKKLIAKNIPVAIVTRISNNSKGKKATWYQVVTQPLPLEKLDPIIEYLKKNDRLKDIKVNRYDDITPKGTEV